MQMVYIAKLSDRTYVTVTELDPGQRIGEVVYLGDTSGGAPIANHTPRLYPDYLSAAEAAVMVAPGTGPSDSCSPRPTRTPWPGWWPAGSGQLVFVIDRPGLTN